MTASRPYEASVENIDLDSEIHRLYYQANLDWSKEARNLVQFGLQDGMSVLELGSGPGFVTEWLSGLVPNGLITAVDIDPVLIKHAEQYLKDKARSRYRLVEASVMDMEFPDNTFDFALARMIFQHLPDPIGAAKEIWRVLKPGGKLVITDLDSGLGPVTDPIVPESQPILEKSRLAQTTVGGDPMIGRSLWRLLKASGFENLDLEAVVLHSAKKGIGWCYPQFDPNRVLVLVKEGLVSEEELQSYRAAVERFMAVEDSFYLSIKLMACGEKL